MNTLGIIAIEAVIALVVAAVVGWIGYRLGRQRAKDEGAYLRVEAEKTLSEAQAKARQMLMEAKDEVIKLRDELDQELRARRQEIQREEDRLKKRREELDNQRERLEQREKKLNQRQAALDKREAELERTYKERVVQLEAKLEEVAGMTREDARNTLLEIVRNEARNDMARVIREVEAEAQEMAEQRARKLVIETMQRVATDVVAERAITTIELPNEEIKGRIIGRNGRNVQAFEQAAGVDIIVDDTPETVTISCFDPVRREIARRALEALLRDGRIHPTRIELSLIHI